MMTGSSRKLCLSVVAALAALSFHAASAAMPTVAQDDFERGVELLRRNRPEEALVEFKKVLAADLSSEEAYELWKETEHEIWLEMLVKGGEYELVAKRLMNLASLGRSERRADPEAIRELLRTIKGDDVVERRRAITTLAAQHGEYAVPNMLVSLGDPNDDDARVKVMHALTEMRTSVVPPLVEAMSSEDAYLRRNVALVLGRIGDPRAAGVLTWRAEQDVDPGVQAAAREAAQRCGSNGDALALFLQAGDDYHHRRARVLRAEDYSDVVWTWVDGGLASATVPRFLYNDEMAKKAYYRALAIAPTSLEARAGIARAYVDAQAKLALRADAGLDVEGLMDQAAEASVAINTTGVDALDLALRWAVEGGDSGTGVALCRHLGKLASAPTTGLVAALRSNDGALRGESAASLGGIAARSATAASTEAVAAMGEAAGREVLRIAAIIDANAERAEAVRSALDEQNLLVNVWPTGARGLGGLHRVPGVDVILLADSLPDLTTAQVIDELNRSDTYAETPILLLTDDAETAADIYGDEIAGTVTGAGELGAVEEALSGGLDRDREQANQLAEKAARILEELAMAGHTDLANALDVLAGGLQGRPDSVTVPAMGALSYAGTASHLAPLVAVLLDEGQSDNARVAAARAVAGILGRDPRALSADAAGGVHGVVLSDASLTVREAAARILGRMSLDPAERAEILQRVRVDARAQS